VPDAAGVVAAAPEAAAVSDARQTTSAINARRNWTVMTIPPIH
jgi:hypothetical protein